MSTQNKIGIICATPDNEGAAVREIMLAFLGTTQILSGIIPRVQVGGSSSLKSVAKRYEGAGPYVGNDPAHIWHLTVPLKEQIMDTQRLKGIIMDLHDNGLMLDHEVWVLMADPDKQITPA